MTIGQTIAELNQMLEGTRITALTLGTPAETITLRRQSGAAVPVPAERFAATAPCSGVFLHRHPLQQAPLVQLGQSVQAGAVLGLLRVGSLLLHMVAPRGGTVMAVAGDGDIVGYGTPLVELVAEEEA